MRAQADGDPGGDDLDDAAEGVAVLSGGVDVLDHRGADGRVGAAHGIGGQALLVLRAGPGNVVGQGDV